MSTNGLLDPDDCALVVIDLQNDFCHPDGAASRVGQETGAVRAAMPDVHRLVALAREAAVPRFFVRTTHSDWFNSDGWLARGRGGNHLPADRVPFVQEGSWGAEWYEVEPGPDDLVITKHRYSAFAYTPLELAFQGTRRRTAVLAGTQTNVCVEATATDAVTRGLHPILVQECVATGSSPALHTAALRDFAQHLGNVVQLADVEAAWSPQVLTGSSAATRVAGR
jgi:ureidoacrylate peracid hydrolase